MKVVHRAGFDPVIYGLLGFNQALYQLSYRCVASGATYGTRTRDFSLDRRALWPLS